jgi:nucleoside-diphosphate-sugar epimerase
MTRVLLTGAGGFIGHHPVKYSIDEGHWVRVIDIGSLPNVWRRDVYPSSPIKPSVQHSV